MAWDAEKIQILFDNAGKMELKELSAIIGKKEAAVAAYASRAGISISFFGHGPKASIKPDVVEEIKRLIETGAMTNRAIAKKAGVKESYVASIKAGRIRRGKKKAVSPGSAQESISKINKIFF